MRVLLGSPSPSWCEVLWITADSDFASKLKLLRPSCRCTRRFPPRSCGTVRRAKVERRQVTREASAEVMKRSGRATFGPIARGAAVLPDVGARAHSRTSSVPRGSFSLETAHALPAPTPH
jgi:hypothetical protein